MRRVLLATALCCPLLAQAQTVGSAVLVHDTPSPWPVGIPSTYLQLWFPDIRPGSTLPAGAIVSSLVPVYDFYYVSQSTAPVSFGGQIVFDLPPGAPLGSYVFSIYQQHGTFTPGTCIGNVPYGDQPAPQNGWPVAPMEGHLSAAGNQVIIPITATGIPAQPGDQFRFCLSTPPIPGPGYVMEGMPHNFLTISQPLN